MAPTSSCRPILFTAIALAWVLTGSPLVVRAEQPQHAAPGLADRVESLAPAWPAERPYAPPEELSFPAGIEHHLVEPGDPDYRFLHDPAVVIHRGEIVAGWYNCPEREIVGESLIRCRRSSDGGKTWSDLEVVAADHENSGVHYVPVQFLSSEGRLHAFVGKMTSHDAIKQCVLYHRDDQAGHWRPLAEVAERFLPNFAPVKMADGNFIMAGRTSSHWPSKPLIPAVAISRGNRLAEPWKVVTLDEPFPNGQCPETTLIVEGPQIVAVTRNNNRRTQKPFLYTSRDFGKTWNEVPEHTLRALDSKLYSGRLSTGQYYVIFNHPLEKAYRGTLVIAVSRPGEVALRNIWKVQESGAGRRGSKLPFMSHYPCAIEAEGKLYVVYSTRHVMTKTCELAIIPVSSLR